jgi:acetyl-CoA C-acetyltransferase
MGHTQLLDSMVHDGLWCPFEDHHMGHAGETIADMYGIGREVQDAYAVRSHQKAAYAAAQGWFYEEILPIAATPRGGSIEPLAHDESVRPDATEASLAALTPAFKIGGTVTAGNAPPVNDGASALLIMSSDRAAALGVRPLARIVGQATSGLAPRLLLMTPVQAVTRLLQKIGWSLAEVDLFELNEAFAVQAVAVMRELDVDERKVNVNGGAVALGHAIGSSGARILTTLIYALSQRGLRRGIATLCLGGGNGVALAIERF